MRKIFRYITIVLIAGGLFQACETTDLDLRVSPNDLAADQADPNLLLNSIQLAYASNMFNMNDLGSEVTRIDYMFGRDYFNNYSGATFNGIWSRTYSSGGNIPGDFTSVGMLTNIATLESIDVETEVDYSFHIGVGKTLAAHQLFLLADYLGAAVWDQALNPSEFPAPELDSGQEIYAAAFNLLDEAESLLSGDPATQGASDLYYGGDTSKWVKLINTIRLRSYKTTGDKAAFDAIIAGGNYISSNDDDFQFTYGSSELQPDTRHPDYAADYTPSGANIYQSNWLMQTMLDYNDPRIRYYFYRQEDATPGADAPPNEETLACSLVVPPQHFQDPGPNGENYVYCSVPNGYWGRTHGNDEGTPPDNFKRTAVGVYPAGGKFDDNGGFTPTDAEPDGDDVGLGEGAGGAGIEPIILAAYVDFWEGEMATSDAERAGHLEDGLTKHIAKVQEFGSLDGSADLSFAPDDQDVQDYIDQIVADFNAASGDDKTNIFAEQYFITMYGGGKEAFNYYRKTGYPTSLVPSWEANPGPFPRSFLYPQNEVITNPTIDQKTTLTEQVFWDNNPASPTFPPAN